MDCAIMCFASAAMHCNQGLSALPRDKQGDKKEVRLLNHEEEGEIPHLVTWVCNSDINRASGGGDSAHVANLGSHAGSEWFLVFIASHCHAETA